MPDIERIPFLSQRDRASLIRYSTHSVATSIPPTSFVPLVCDGLGVQISTLGVILFGSSEDTYRRFIFGPLLLVMLPLSATPPPAHF